MVTSFTFKQAKNEYLKRNWDPSTQKGEDSLYWLNGARYEKLERDSWGAIDVGRAKL
jgi:hypothetical protein